MTLIPPAPPGPIAGQPGHFAWTDWAEESLGLLSLPSPQTAYSNGAILVTTGATPTPSPCVITVTNPDPVKLLQVMLTYNCRVSFTQASGGVYVAPQSTGATIIGEGNAGEYIYIGVMASANAGAFTWLNHRLVTLNPGATVLTLSGRTTAPATASVNFWHMTAVPVGWL